MLVIGKEYRLNRARIKFYIVNANWDDSIYKDSSINTVVIKEHITDNSVMINHIESTISCYSIISTDKFNGYYFPEDCFSKDRLNKLKRIL